MLRCAVMRCVVVRCGLKKKGRCANQSQPLFLHRALADHEHHPVELSRRRSIVFFQDRGVWDRRYGATPFAASSINLCRRGIAAPVYSLNTVLQSRHASCTPEKSFGFPSKRVLTPTPVACVPRSCKLVRRLLSTLPGHLPAQS